MRRLRSKLRRFLTAEEVPRWFGLSLVLIYLVGLGCVAHYGIVQARREGARDVQRSSRFALRLLAEKLSAAPARDDPTASRVNGWQRQLERLAREVPVRWLRLVDAERRVVASTALEQIDTVLTNEVPSASNQAVWEVVPLGSHGHGTADVFVRARVTIADAAAADSADPSVADEGSSLFYLEARLPSDAKAASGVADQARILATVLVVLGALFVVYRCLREQLRGVSRIADQLRSSRDRWEEDLRSLRIGDAADHVTAAWNELIELALELQDTVRRSEANEELSRVLQRNGGGALAEALNAVPEGIIYITDEVRFEYVNASACHLFDWDAEQARQTSLSEAVSTGLGAQVLEVLHNALQSDGSYQARSDTLLAEDEGGTDRSTYRVRVIPLQRGHHAGECVVLIRDISQQTRSERAREEFITQVTHELRTPLTNIRAYVETLSSGMFEDPSVITECYNVITKETRRLSRLVEDILNVSQLEVGTIELNVDDVDLKTLLTESVRDVRGLADEKNIDLQLVLPSKLEPIRGDRDKLAVVVNNLLGNAIKYTREEGNIVVGCRGTGDEVTIFVKDNGIGIEPADQARVFEKFQRAADPAVQAETGSGIGLYTAREIVRRHRGDIELISERGQGSTFVVRLPRPESRASVLTAAAEEA
jgi:signal transduction histidine kinase